MNGAFNYSIGVSWKPLRNVLSRRKSLEHTMPSLSFNPGSGIKGQESNWKIVLWRIVRDKITRKILLKFSKENLENVSRTVLLHFCLL